MKIIASFKQKKFSVLGTKLQFYFWGHPKKPRLFLFHGWLDTGASFEFLCKYLQKDFYCIAVDLPGYGKSEHTTNPFGYFFFEYLAILDHIFKRLSENEPLNLLGHSLGGSIISAYAGVFPEKVATLINMEGFGLQNIRDIPPPERVQMWIQGMGKKQFQHHASLKDFASRLHQTNPRLPLERADFLARQLAKKTPQGYIMAADPQHKLIEPYTVHPEDTFQFWDRITAKTLFVMGDDTEIIQLLSPNKFSEYFAKIKEHLPKDCLWVNIPKAGHMIHHERPEELAKVVKIFLK